VGIADGGMLVGAGVEVDSITGTSVAVQAVRRKKRIGMIFFMMTVCHCEEGWWLSSPSASRGRIETQPDEAISA